MDVEESDIRLTETLNVMVRRSQKTWLERASERRQSSVGAIVRTAIEEYRQRHPDLGL